jgi:hypothetical protein
MLTLMVCYEPNEPMDSYKALVEKLQTYRAWWCPFGTTWFIVTELTVERVRDELIPFVFKDDDLLVIDVTGAAWSSYQLPESGTDWLKEQVSRIGMS